MKCQVSLRQTLSFSILSGSSGAVSFVDGLSLVGRMLGKTFWSSFSFTTSHEREREQVRSCRRRCTDVIVVVVVVLFLRGNCHDGNDF